MNRYSALLCLALILQALQLAGQESYILRRGDTLYRVSKQFDIPVSVLQACNEIRDPAQLREGTPIRIPQAYTVKKGDTLYSIAREHAVGLAELMKLNGLVDSATLIAGRKLYFPFRQSAAPTGSQANTPAKGAAETGTDRSGKAGQAGETLLWPHPGKRESLSGRITGSVIYGRAGDRIVSVSSGRVVWVGPYRGFSRVVLIESENGYTYVYAGNEETLVAVGDYVRQGTEIGLLGRNAHQGIPQLYFLIYRDGMPVDPSQAPRS